MAHKTFISYKWSEAQDLRDDIITALGEEATYEFTVDKNVELTANFKKTEKPVEKVTICLLYTSRCV